MRSKSAPETKCQSVSNIWKPAFQAGIDASALLVPVEAPQPSQFEGSDDSSQVFVQALWQYGVLIKLLPGLLLFRPFWKISSVLFSSENTHAEARFPGSSFMSIACFR